MKDTTLVTVAGRAPEANFGIVNPPVYRASTVLYPTVEAMHAARPGEGVYYGRYGTPTTFALEEAIAQLEGGWRSIVVGSGKAAIVTTLLALTRAGDHVLMVDTAYAPTRRVCEVILRKFGVVTTYYDPAVGEAIADLIRPETRLVFIESPGSLTFDVQDVPAIAAAAHARGVLVLMDNTWASPLFFKPFRHGVDISIQAVTKYVGGHSDLMMGSVTTTEEVWERVRAGVHEVGTPAGPDDCWLALRGLRTLAARLERHQASALRLASWLRARPEVDTVLYPALPGAPGHELWKRDFLGASGLFGFVLKPCTKAAVAAMLDHMELFGMGYSWGGYESLLIPTDPTPCRSAVPWSAEGQLMRIHVGLEDPDDLIADLDAGFARLQAGG
ncbi:MAG TPA: cystathionine beta-lyase [Geminicoccaceae bacterium]|nr:cystathionine beta-lyase [Geminicoccaceae bacterium]